MDARDLRAIVDAELVRLGRFRNLHGITPDNIQQFLVEPFPVNVDPDDLETLPRDMWVVLQTAQNPTSGYCVAFDPASSGWSVVEHVQHNS